MRSAQTLRAQIEATLEARIPCALTPVARSIQEAEATGITSIDSLLASGGLPAGVLVELTGAACSGRTTLALSFITQLINTGKVAAWIDASNTLSPESAAACGMDLKRLLWVRCGVERSSLPCSSGQDDFRLPTKYFPSATPKKGLHGIGFGPHPCTELKGLPDGVTDLLQTNLVPAQRTNPLQKIHTEQVELEQPITEPFERKAYSVRASSPRTEKIWTRIEQALRATDLLLKAGGFGAIVLDMGSMAPEDVSRIPSSTWFRYGAAAERSRSTVLLLTQYASAKSSANIVLRLRTVSGLAEERTFFAGLEFHAEILRQRVGDASEKVAPFRKPPQSVRSATWQSRTPWAGIR